MNRMLVTVFLVLSSLGLSGCGTYDWHQKMTVEVETPDGVKAGSAVTSISWWKNRFFKDGAAYQTKYIGDAVVVDLDRGRFLFALLSYSNNEEYIANLATRVLYETYDMRERAWSDEAFKRTMAAKGPILVPSKLYPLFVTFSDINDPKTVEQVDPANFATSFGPGYALKSVMLEIVDESVAEGKIEGVLRWLSEFPETRLCKPGSGNNFSFCAASAIDHGDFIRR
jgi:hypothetical protein